MIFSDFINSDMCLYCGTEFSSVDSFVSTTEESTEYKCKNCLEFFMDSLIYSQPFAGHYFVFSCKDIIVFVNLISEKITVFKINSVTLPITNDLPYFYLDFKDKNRLYFKLKTYLSFS